MIKYLLINKSYVFLFLLCILVGLSAIGTNLESLLRYVKYLIPILFLFISFFGIKNLKISRVLLKNLELCVFLLVINFTISIIKFEVTSRFFQEALLILLPIFSIIMVTTLVKKPINEILQWLFYTYVVVFAASNYAFFFNIDIINEFIKALKTSQLATESWMAFPFGLFTIFFLLEKKYKKFLLALVLFLFAFKRIAILGFIIGISVYWLLTIRETNRFNKKNTYVWFITINLLMVILLFNFIKGNFDQLIFDLVGISPNWFTQGRLRVYNDTLEYFSSNLLFGNSLGSTSTFLQANFEHIHLLHSDILKLIIEFGLVLYIIWLFVFFKINLVAKKAVAILLFINILFLSDNVFIYFDTLFIFYLLIVYYAKRSEVKDV